MKVQFLLSIFLFLSCNSNTHELATDIQPCNKKHDVIKVLKNEPAFIQKRCMDFYINDIDTFYNVRVDTFCIILVNEHSEFFFNAGMFPCGEIPEQYRQDGLSVYISGNVTSDVVSGGCSEPNIRIAGIPVFELSSIRINNKTK